MSRMTHQDYQIGRQEGVCAATGRALEPGDVYVGVLIEREGEEGFDRLDYDAGAWSEAARPAGLFAMWRGVVPEREERARRVVDEATAVGLFESLEGAEETKPVVLRFVLALLLMRRRQLYYEGAGERDGRRVILLRRKGEPAEGGATVEVVDPEIDEASLRSVSERVQALLGSG